MIVLRPGLALRTLILGTLLNILLLQRTAALAPIILVPGLAGSVFRAKLDGAAKPHFWCASTADWFNTWLNLEQLIPAQKDCLLSRLALSYNTTSGVFGNAKGVQIDSNVDFGGAGGVAYVDPVIKAAMPYFGPMIDNLTATLGYRVGTDLHGAGYDWRLGPLGHAQPTAPGGYFSKLKHLIESTVSNNSAKAHIISHSLGGPTMQAFLQIQGAEWASAHVESFIPLSSPWLGGARMALTEVGGDNLGEPIPHDYLRLVQQQAESGVFIMPFGSAWGNGTMVSTPSKNYTVNQLPDMFLDLGLAQTFELYDALNRSKLLAGQLEPPAVPTHVMYSTGVETDTSFVYDEDFKPTTDLAPSSVLHSDGDGTVNLVSLTWAEASWGDRVNATYFSLQEIEHSKTVASPVVWGRIIKIVTGQLVV